MKAVIFDLDGVVVDSEKDWNKAEKEIYVEATGSEDVDIDALSGMSISNTYNYLDSNFDMDISRNEFFNLYRERVNEIYGEKAELMDKFKDLTESLREEGLKIGLATGSYWPNYVIERFDLDFDTVVDSNKVEGEGKPEPETYRMAVESLGVAPEEAVAIDDTDSGIKSANVARPEEVSDARENGADGIGLYRTEFMFLDRDKPPTEDEHYRNYVEALEAFPDNRIIVRTLDIGGDKPVPYLDIDGGENPFLGPRGIRLAFEEGEELFETQIRALLRAAATENGEKLAVMFPLVASLEEFEKARKKVEELGEGLEEEGEEFDIPELGLMVETPSAVQIAGDLAKEADFLSIGTNDLIQYTMAASRTDNRVSDLQDPLYPAVLCSIKQTVEQGHENDAWVGMCGEMAGDPELTELLVGLGLDELSMSSSLAPDVKSNVEEISASDAENFAENALSMSRRENVADVIK